MITKQQFNELFNNRQFNIDRIDEGEFLETIKYLYAKQDMTQKELADYVNCGLATICRYLARCNIRTARTKTHEQFMTELKEVNSNLELLEKYTKSYQHLLTKCKICGHKWKITPDNLLQGVGCPKCGQKDWQQQVRKSHEEFMAELKEKNDHNLEVLEEYQWRREKILVHCSECDHEWRVTPNNLLKGHGCPECKWERIRKAQMKSHQQFLAELNAITDQFTPLEEYNGTDNPIAIRCNECDNQWEVAPSNLLRGYGCPGCNNSAGEERIRDWLKQNGISYILQYIDESCRYIKPLRFDFYLPKQQIMIEYDGGIHFKPIDHFGGREEFKKRRIRDEIKNNWCREHNYLLIRISNLAIIQEQLTNLLIDQQLKHVNQLEEYWNQELDFCIITAR